VEEIAIEGKSVYLSAGGREFHAIPCLNERDDWIQALADIVLTQLMGWTDAAAHEALELSRLRALSFGAKH
jgi:ferrochelatase